jgi:hypothetical protein
MHSINRRHRGSLDDAPGQRDGLSVDEKPSIQALERAPGIWGVAYSGREYARLRLDQVRRPPEAPRNHVSLFSDSRY